MFFEIEELVKYLRIIYDEESKRDNCSLHKFGIKKPYYKQVKNFISFVFPIDDPCEYLILYKPKAFDGKDKYIFSLNSRFVYNKEIKKWEEQSIVINENNIFSLKEALDSLEVNNGKFFITGKRHSK